MFKERDRERCSETENGNPQARSKRVIQITSMLAAFDLDVIDTRHGRVRRIRAVDAHQLELLNWELCCWQIPQISPQRYAYFSGEQQQQADKL